jgi:PAS domain S-box-containing protein
MDHVPSIGAGNIVESLSDGVYTCDLDRRITYWSRQAEHITGWRAEDVVGRRCRDNVLCHVDKDGHVLCGEEHCPLHRAMMTGVASAEGLLVYAQSKDGTRIPTSVTVAPLRNEAGEVIGGVEAFRDASSEIRDLERAKAIQGLALQHELPDDDRVTFTTHYIPHGIIGGDYYAIEQLDGDRYGLMVADVTGHGVPAALYTMHLSQLWDRHRRALTDPVEFASRVNDELYAVLKTDESFATAVCGLIDLDAGTFRFAGAGGPAPVLFSHAGGTHESLENPGLPLGVMADARYEETTVDVGDADRLLLFSDGAVEVMDERNALIGVEGLLEVLKSQGYPDRDIDMDALEEGLLRYSNAIRLPDDLTLMEIHFGRA